MDRKNVEGYR